MLNQAITLSIIDYNGRVINTKTFEEFNNHTALSLNIEGLAKGLYQLIIEQGSTIETKRFNVIN